jgi:hypothetical protein
MSGLWHLGADLELLLSLRFSIQLSKSLFERLLSLNGVFYLLVRSRVKSAI